MFDAYTVHVYVLLLVKPDTTIGELVPVAVPGVPPSDDTHAVVYPVIGDPPSDEGGVNATLTLEVPGVSDGGAGASGTAINVTGADATEAGPSPLAFDANTVHVYVLPGVKLATVTGDDTSTPRPAAPPSADVHAAVNFVSGDPPSNGGTNDTSIDPMSPTTVGCTGALGSAFNNTATDGTDAGPSPLTFDANTVQR